ncbi:MAG: peptidoglycan DD-metalloendopeptidase family protein [Oscillochloridaceae bacterium]|nr:peptidoglycan DD-metalloendopeptidase family protein [Chloroflexaceae bacterium]MDW8391396.1 peptidoglycan DD-metalloendopeptidase family protein [Oscillochloridaceae bacterium]
MPRSHAFLPCRSIETRPVPFRWLLALLALLLALFSSIAPRTVQAAPVLILPTPPGEDWRIIQGYACGTHNGWDRYSLDLAQVNGPTYDAPIRAAAGGAVWYWEWRSGTLILRHSASFFTMYTHLARAVSTQPGRYFQAGETLGFAGDRGSPGVPHLHFTAYTARGDGWSGKQSVPLRFAEGIDLPEIGGCNQHGGKIVRAASIKAPEVAFQSAAQPGQWYAGDQRIEFVVAWGGGGLSQAWNQAPPADAPMFARVTDGYAQLADAGEGMHTLKVRAWGPDGRVTLAEFGPVGYDVTPPHPPAPIGDLAAPTGPVALQWPPASDAHSGVKGYRVYVGPNPEGTSEWFTTEPAVRTEPLAPGRYLLRVQALDVAGNAGQWVTLGAVTVGP